MCACVTACAWCSARRGCANFTSDNTAGCMPEVCYTAGLVVGACRLGHCRKRRGIRVSAQACMPSVDYTAGSPNALLNPEHPSTSIFKQVVQGGYPEVMVCCVAMKEGVRLRGLPTFWPEATSTARGVTGVCSKHLDPRSFSVSLRKDVL